MRTVDPSVTGFHCLLLEVIAWIQRNWSQIHFMPLARKPVSFSLVYCPLTHLCPYMYVQVYIQSFIPPSLYKLALGYSSLSIAVLLCREGNRGVGSILGDPHTRA